MVYKKNPKLLDQFQQSEELGIPLGMYGISPPVVG
jgi:hypothetical protein